MLERHPQIGHRMLESLGVDPVAEWVLHHHERWDGSGYPDGVGGDQIPLGARIIFVADAYDAMTFDRVYRGRLSDDEAVAELAAAPGRSSTRVWSRLALELGAADSLLTAVPAQPSGTSRVAVALKEATSRSPSANPSRLADAAVTSAVSGPRPTRTRFPSVTSERTSPRTWFTVAESDGACRASETSHG